MDIGTHKIFNISIDPTVKSTMIPKDNTFESIQDIYIKPYRETIYVSGNII